MLPNGIGVYRNGNVTVWWEVEGRKVFHNYRIELTEEQQESLFRLLNPHWKPEEETCYPTISESSTNPK